MPLVLIAVGSIMADSSSDELAAALRECDDGREQNKFLQRTGRQKHWRHRKKENQRRRSEPAKKVLKKLKVRFAFALTPPLLNTVSLFPAFLDDQIRSCVCVFCLFPIEHLQLRDVTPTGRPPLAGVPEATP